MSILVDTNVLVRLASASDPSHRTAADAIDLLSQLGEVVHIVPQSLYEFWVVCTRPATQNGLGLAPAQAHAELTRFRIRFALLDETPAILSHWEQLVTQHQVSGKSAHDAHLVAAMTAHQIGRILTFNPSDFQRFPAIVVLTPQQVLASAPPPP